MLTDSPDAVLTLDIIRLLGWPTVEAHGIHTLEP